MKYFKNTELAKLYKVSEKSVRNWIVAAQSGKIDLQLYEKGDKFFVANTSKNNITLESLVKKGQKYKNTRGLKTITPSPKFYELYDSKQIFEIVSSLNVHRELPLQYNYLSTGADDWDNYVGRLEQEETPNMLNSCRELLETNLDSLDRLIGGEKRINIIDIGIGNCLPVKGLVDHLIQKGQLNRYIGIDISDSMLKIAKQNMISWFGEKNEFEFYDRDISHEEFGDLIARDYFSGNEDIPTNVILLLGGTLANFEVPDDILRTVHRSIQPGDLFISSLKLDTPNSRQYFDLDPDPNNAHQVASWHRFVLDLLNIDESLYEVHQVFDEERKARFIGAKLKVDVSIKFKINKGEHTIDLHKGETILVLRYWHQSATDVMRLFEKNGFEILQTSKTRDHEYFLIISEVSKNTP